MGMAKQSINIKADTTQYRGLLKALNEMDKDAKGQLKNDVKPIAAMMAKEIKAAAPQDPFSRQAQMVAKSVRAQKDRMPYVAVGGARKVFRNGATAGEAVFGSEFGANPGSKAGSFPNGGRRFPYRSAAKGAGNLGYWIFPTAKRLQPEIRKMWQDACNKVLDNWKRG